MSNGLRYLIVLDFAFLNLFEFELSRGFVINGLDFERGCLCLGCFADVSRE